MNVADGAVSGFMIVPENPVKGDFMTIYGTADPNEEVRIDISFEKIVSVKNGEYEFSVKGIEILKGENRFTVIAYGCSDLDVSARK